MAGSFLVFAPIAAASSETAEFEAGTISEIVVQGLRKVEREAAVRVMTLRIGQAFKDDAVTADLHSLWQTGFFRDVAISRAPGPGDTIRLLVSLSEKPTVLGVDFEGLSAVSKEDVLEVVDVRENTILNLKLLGRNADKIKVLLVDKGHYLAEIGYRVDPVPDSPDGVRVVFEIAENDQVVVRQISFLGNTTISDAELKANIQTREGDELSFFTQSGTYNAEHFQTDILRIQALYYDRGYIAVKVGSPTATISPDLRHIYLSLAIDEGPRHDVGDIVFSGDIVLTADDGKTLVDEALLQKLLMTTSGEVFSRATLMADLSRVTDAYRNHGYAYANVIPNTRPVAGTQLVNLDLEIDRGEPVHIGRIEIIGNTRTRDKVIRREMRVFEGELFSETGVKTSEMRINQLGYFETVEIKRKSGKTADRMDLEVRVKEKSTGTFQIGAGFSSVESFIFTAQISQQNFLGNGQSLSLSAQLSFGDFGRQLATLQFWDPWFLDSKWGMGINGFITQQFFRDFQRSATGFSPSLGYPITHALRVNLGYTLEQIGITTGSSSSGAALHNLNRDGLNSKVNGSISYDTRDNRLFPTRGQYHSFGLEVSDPAIGADSDMAFQRLSLDMRYFHPLFWTMVFKANASMSWVFGGGTQGVPISERFFPGGIFSVRGFSPRSLGPLVRTTRKGDPLSPTSRFILGGDKEAVFNLEVEFDIVPKAGIKGVFFLDAGNAYNDDDAFFYIDSPTAGIPDSFVRGSNRRIKPPLGLYWAAGFGVRWFSPVGPLRFEWGMPLVKLSPADPDLLFEFTIGNFF